MKDSKVLLSILIPTYNRGDYLKLALDSIVSQINLENNKKIEIIISNNCSTDNTDEIIKSFLHKNEDKNIKYYYQEQNLGADRNFLFLLEKSNGKFGWIFGDDEILLGGAINSIIENIELDNNIGLIHLKGYGYKEDYIKEKPLEKKIETITYREKEKFIAESHVMLAFISANIFNKKYLDKQFDYTRGKGTCLIQEYMYFQSLFNADKNIIIFGNLYASKSENYSGGYKQIEVFSKNFNEIFNYFILRGVDKKYFKIINEKMCLCYFPHYIKIRDENKFKLLKEKNTFKMLFKIYKFFPEFWLCCAPIYINKNIGYKISKINSKILKIIKNPILIKDVPEKIKQKFQKLGDNNE